MTPVTADAKLDYLITQLEELQEKLDVLSEALDAISEKIDNLDGGSGYQIEYES